MRLSVIVVINMVRMRSPVRSGLGAPRIKKGFPKGNPFFVLGVFQRPPITLSLRDALCRKGGMRDDKRAMPGKQASGSGAYKICEHRRCAA